MRTVPSFSISAFLTMSVLLLTGCGGGGESSAQPSGVASTTYGSLTLSGTGTDIAGTTFNAVSRIGPTTMSQRYNVDIGSGLTYPSVVPVVAINGAGEIMVDFNYLISSTQASGEWVNFPVPPGTVVVTSTGVTFTNLDLSGYGGTTTTLTLNGTLTF